MAHFVKPLASRPPTNPCPSLDHVYRYCRSEIGAEGTNVAASGVSVNRGAGKG